MTSRRNGPNELLRSWDVGYGSNMVCNLLDFYFVLVADTLCNILQLIIRWTHIISLCHTECQRSAGCEGARKNTAQGFKTQTDFMNSGCAVKVSQSLPPCRPWSFFSNRDCFQNNFKIEARNGLLFCRCWGRSCGTACGLLSVVCAASEKLGSRAAHLQQRTAGRIFFWWVSQQTDETCVKNPSPVAAHSPGGQISQMPRLLRRWLIEHPCSQPVPVEFCLIEYDCSISNNAVRR